MIKKILFIAIVFLYIFLVRININFYKFKPSSTIEVYVTGSIENEGKFILNKDSKINDLFQVLKFKSDANTSNFDLNKSLFHNDHIHIYSNKDLENKISINIASIDELTKISGIGIKTATKIVEYRELNGYFKNIEEIKNINGIGEKKFEQIKQYLSI